MLFGPGEWRLESLNIRKNVGILKFNSITALNPMRANLFSTEEGRVAQRLNTQPGRIPKVYIEGFFL